MLHIAAALTTLLLVARLGTAEGACSELLAPVEGVVVRSFAPIGTYAGHWGLDFATARGSEVRAAEHGRVSFAGAVAGRLSVTIDHGGGLKTSYSYLAEIGVRPGVSLHRGAVVGTSGSDHGGDVVHFSVRVDGQYIDPEPWMGCRVPGGGVRLLPTVIASPNLAGRAARHSRGYVRSPTHRTSHRRRGRLPPARAGRRYVRPRRCPMAEGRPRRIGRGASMEDDELGD